jgi:hypothetical protein
MNFQAIYESILRKVLGFTPIQPLKMSRPPSMPFIAFLWFLNKSAKLKSRVVFMGYFT